MRVLLVLGLVMLAGCSGADKHNRNLLEDRVDLPVYVPTEAPKLTVFTVVNNQTGAGGHTALLVTGSEQVLFDPAGSFRHEGLVESEDVLYGVSAGWVQAFKSAHARNTYHVVSQEFAVTSRQAETALALVKSNGSVGNAFCTNATTKILRQVPGFSDVDVTFFPKKLMNQIATRPGVVTQRYYENDEGDVVDGIVAYNG